MKTVLIALDYDPSAEKVAEIGYQLAKAMNAEIILLHVLADMSYYMPMEYATVMGFTGIPQGGLVEPVDLESLKKGAESFLNSSKQHLGDPAIQTMVAEGNFAEEILKTAREKNASIIVVGSHSRSAFEKILAGSVTEQLLHDSKIPLFIIPTKG